MAERRRDRHEPPLSRYGAHLETLRQSGSSVAIVSDIHYELEPDFAAYGMAGFIDHYVLSYEFGWQKPDSRLFQAALDSLEVLPQHALMAGDRPVRNAGGVALDTTTLTLPPVPNVAMRGLDALLRLM